MARRTAREPEDDQLDYAMWWVARWISGSMDDPDWSWPEAETITVEQAFAVVQDRIGNAMSATEQCWRFLNLPETEADRLFAGGDLHPHARSTFQSFTGSHRLARDFGEEEFGGPDQVPVIVRVEAPPECVMFGMEDLRRDGRAADTVRTLADWHHQKEIIVRVDRPLKVLKAYRMVPRAESELYFSRDDIDGVADHSSSLGFRP